MTKQRKLNPSPDGEFCVVPAPSSRHHSRQTEASDGTSTRVAAILAQAKTILTRASLILAQVKTIPTRASAVLAQVKIIPTRAPAVSAQVKIIINRLKPSIWLEDACDG